MNQAIESIHSLNLQYLVHRIVKQYKDDPLVVCEAVRRYKNFLILRVLYPDCKLVPTRAIDIVWHEHILHTEKYREDCMHIFGDFFHHYPNNETPMEQEMADANYIQTAQLYERYFQESYGNTTDITIWFRGRR